MTNISSTLNETITQRGATYGGFINNATVSEGIMETCRAMPNWKKLPVDVRCALAMIAQKIGRIVTGVEHEDNWHDIAGYAVLVERRIQKDKDNAKLTGASTLSSIQADAQKLSPFAQAQGGATDLGRNIK